VPGSAVEGQAPHDALTAEPGALQRPLLSEFSTSVIAWSRFARVVANRYPASSRCAAVP
jgi:hypothetical protein